MSAKHSLIWWSKVLTKWKIPDTIALVKYFTPLVETDDRVMVGRESGQRHSTFKGREVHFSLEVTSKQR